MRLIKRQTTNLRSIKGSGITRDINGVVDFDSQRAFRLPAGSTENRPVPAQEGYIRFNTTLGEIEAFLEGEWKTGLGSSEDPETIVSDIVQQRFAEGFGSGKYYGPLESRADDYTRIDQSDYDDSFDPSQPYSMIVLIGNAYQIGGNENSNIDADYSLVLVLEQGDLGPGVPVNDIGWYLEFTKPNESGLPVTVVHNFNK